MCWLVKEAYERYPPAPKQCVFGCYLGIHPIQKLGSKQEVDPEATDDEVGCFVVDCNLSEGSNSVESVSGWPGSFKPSCIQVKNLLKHNRLGDSLSTIILKLFDECKKLCMVRTLKEYVNGTDILRGEEKQLLVSFAAPYARISRDTLSRWTLFVLNKAVVDTKKYASHSTRGASTSAAKRLGISVNLIMKQAGWRNADSFAGFYNKDIEEDTDVVARTLLHNAM